MIVGGAYIGGAYKCPDCGRKISNGYPGSRCYHGVGNPKVWSRMKPDYLRLVPRR